MTIKPTEILAAFNMPPDKAVDYLKSKGIVPTDAWDDLIGRAHRRAFTVARSAGFDILNDIKAALLDALNNGTSYQDFLKELEPTLRQKGWWGNAIDKKTGEIIKVYDGTSTPVEYGSPRRLKLIYEQNLQVAYMAGRYRTMSAATDTHPYWQYIAILDGRTRPDHRALHGSVFAADDAIWQTIYPPNGFHCRCTVWPVSEAGMMRQKLTPVTNYSLKEITHTLKDGSIVKIKKVVIPGHGGFAPDKGWDHNPAIDYLAAA